MEERNVEKRRERDNVRERGRDGGGRVRGEERKDTMQG